MSEFATARRLPSSLRLQRTYDDPQSDDGYRVLVDRVWPRGRTKAELGLDAWERDLGPSTDLRKWFGHDPARWIEFQTRYRVELADPERARVLDELAALARHGRVTIVYGARDREHNQAQVIADEIARRLRARRRLLGPLMSRPLTDRAQALGACLCRGDETVAEAALGLDVARGV